MCKKTRISDRVNFNLEAYVVSCVRLFDKELQFDNCSTLRYLVAIGT